MSYPEHPFVDSGEGFPTAESVREALIVCKLGALADVQVNYRGKSGSMVDLLTQCRIEHLLDNWPMGFASEVYGSAAQAAQQE